MNRLPDQALAVAEVGACAHRGQVHVPRPPSCASAPGHWLLAVSR
jgi:hypothetical protein